MKIVFKVRSFFRKLKCFYYIGKYRLKNVHHSSLLSSKSYVSKDVTIGKYSYIGPGAYICPNVTLGNYCMLGQNVTITGGDHRFDIVGQPMIFSGSSTF